MVKQVNEFEEILGEKRKPMEIALKDAKAMMQRGLEYFVGKGAQWLSGYDDVAQWLQDNKHLGLYLYGSNGRGKSIVCYNIIPNLIRFYYKWAKIYKCRANNLRNIYIDKNEYYAMLSADVIFIDDIGTESLLNLYGEKKDAFSDIVDIVEQEHKILVISSNLDPKDINERYGSRTLDRMRATTRVICFVGESMRNNNNNT